MSAKYDMYNEPTQWGRGAEDVLSLRVSLEELRFLGSRGVDVDDFLHDERLARDMRSAERISGNSQHTAEQRAGQAAVTMSLEARQ